MATRFHVVVTDFVCDDFAPERALLDGLAEVVGLDAQRESELVGHIEQADALIVFHAITISAETIARLEQCRLIVRAGVGYDNVDLAAARQKRIDVANVPDYGTEEVADSAIGMMLTLARGIHLLNPRFRGDRHASYQFAAPIHRLRGRVFGIVGLGRIGMAAALRAQALGMDVAFYDPYKSDGYDKAIGAKRIDRLEDLLAEAHVLSLHCPLTDETTNMIDAQAIAAMPRGAFLINTARGGIVDTGALPAALASGQLAGAALDVLPTEPPAEDDPLIVAWRDPQHAAHERLILNPHAAFYSEEGLREMRTKAAENIARALRGGPVRNVVN